MGLLIRGVVPLFLMFLLILVPARAERHALLIGNAAYQARPLKNPLNDVSAMQKKLTGLGFKVIAKSNLNRRQTREQIRLFAAKLKANDEALFYFSGHGAQVNGQNYLIPLGNDIRMEDEVSDEAVPLNFVLNKLTASPARLNMVILDACRDNPFQSRFKSSAKGLARFNQHIKSTIVAFSASAGGVSDDGDQANGVYTLHLLKHLATPNITLNQMFNRVRADVNKATAGKQLPIEENGLLSDVYLLRVQQQKEAEQTSTGIVTDEPPRVNVKSTTEEENLPKNQQIHNHDSDEIKNTSRFLKEKFNFLIGKIYNVGIFLFNAFGYMFYLTPIIIGLMLIGVKSCSYGVIKCLLFSTGGLLLFVIGGSGLSTILFSVEGGGSTGILVVRPIFRIFGSYGLTVILLYMFLDGILLMLGIRWGDLVEYIGEKILYGLDNIFGEKTYSAPVRTSDRKK